MELAIPIVVLGGLAYSMRDENQQLSNTKEQSKNKKVKSSSEGTQKINKI